MIWSKKPVMPWNPSNAEYYLSCAHDAIPERENAFFNDIHGRCRLIDVDNAFKRPICACWHAKCQLRGIQSENTKAQITIAVFALPQRQNHSVVTEGYPSLWRNRLVQSIAYVDTKRSNHEDAVTSNDNGFVSIDFIDSCTLTRTKRLW